MLTIVCPIKSNKNKHSGQMYQLLTNSFFQITAKTNIAIKSETVVRDVCVCVCTQFITDYS